MDLINPYRMQTLPYTLGFSKDFNSVWDPDLLSKILGAGFLPCLFRLRQSFLGTGMLKSIIMFLLLRFFKLLRTSKESV